jgi:protein gp37
MENTNIEWTDHTFNPWMGCTKVSPGCDHCYAERDMDHRLHRVQWGPQGERVRTVASNWRKPVQWNAAAAAFLAEHGRRQRVFCASLADVFDNKVDPAWRADLLALIDSTPNLDWLLLTKRVGNVATMLPAGWLEAHPNVWLGASIVNQEEADRDIPKLLRLPARVRFLSMEPLLGPVDLFSVQTGELLHTSGNEYNPGSLDWIIVGGESGPEARPMAPAWARSLRDQCEAAGVPFLFKQWGEWGPYDRGRTDAKQLAMPGALDAPMALYGKKLAGRQLDGAHYDGYPKVAE